MILMDITQDPDILMKVYSCSIYVFISYFIKFNVFFELSFFNAFMQQKLSVMAQIFFIPRQVKKKSKHKKPRSVAVKDLKIPRQVYKMRIPRIESQVLNCPPAQWLPACIHCTL